MENKNTVKKRSTLRKILKWSGLTFLFLLIALITIPFLFQDKIKDLVLAQANKMLKADIAVGDFDLTIIRTFPNMTFTFNDVTITGREEFDGVRLVDIGEFQTRIGFWSIFRTSNIEIYGIEISDAAFDVRILEDGTANYDIVKSTEELAEEYPEELDEQSPFNLKLRYYALNNIDLRYADDQGDMYLDILGLSHSGSGDFTADITDLRTQTAIKELSFAMDNLNYLRKVKLDMLMNMKMTFKDDGYTFELAENEITMNEVKLALDGSYGYFENHQEMHLELLADRTTFKDFLSLVPAFYLTGYESMLANGDFNLNAKISGSLDDSNYPAFNISSNIRNGRIRYPDLPSSIENIRLDFATVFAGGANLDNMTVDLKKFHAAFDGNTIDAELLLRSLISDPRMALKLQSLVDLSKLKNVIPLEEGVSYNGIFASDVQLNGRMSDLDNEDYEAFQAEGKIALSSFNYVSSDLPDGVTVDEMLFEFTPQILLLQYMNGQMGITDFQMKGSIDNYFGYFFRDEPLEGHFDLQSNVFDLNAFIPTFDEDEAVNADVNTEGILVEEYVQIPNNLYFTFTTRIGQLLYEDMDIRNFTGKIVLDADKLDLSSLNMQTLGGEVGLSGYYHTPKRAIPNIAFSYDLRNIDIELLSKHFATVEKMAPVIQHARGNVSSRLHLVSDVLPDFSPVLNTVTGHGKLTSNAVRIENLKFLERLGNFIDVSNLENTTFRNLNIYFEFIDGLLAVKPFDVNIGNIRSTVSGTTSFEQEIDYIIDMQLPKSVIPREIVKLAEQGIAQAKRIPGFEIKTIPDPLDVRLKVLNTVTDPQISSNLRERLMEEVGNVRESVKEAIEEKVKEVIDSAKAVVKEKVEDIKDDLRERRDKLLLEAQERADRVVAEARVLADRTRREANQNADRIISEAGNNPIQRRLAEESARKVRDTGESSARRIESEAQQRANTIMQRAREEAERLE
ncbi:MAG: hypothetical protein JJT77_12570 [Crocinitomicaceae bacterium]|nr:hypothetical protein [Crocinitomicaceae bacterium]